MTEGTRWRIVADWWAGVPRRAIVARYGCDKSYPPILAKRRGFERCQPDTLRKPHRVIVKARRAA